MNRTGLLIALGIGVVAGTLLGVFPGIDLAVTRPFYDTANNAFMLPRDPAALMVRDAIVYVIAAIAAVAIVAVVVKLILPRRPMLIPGRAALFMIATLALAPGLMTNVILKDYWGRPRPYSVQQFGEKEPFVPWWDPRGTCDKNCSFVAGEGSGAFWVLAPAAITPPAVRPFAYAAALAFAVGTSIFRIAFGAHFLSDTIFAGVFTFLMIWLVHGAIYRWRATRLTDEQVEGAIARVTLPLHDAIFRTGERKSQ
jgi:membrane-associated PAP2 superfamily phosphatase